MKVYVDKLPKCCLECDSDFCEHQFIECCYADRHPDCPLQSLADHDKQVRKEVVQEIRERSELFGVCKTGIIKEEYRIDKEILDQIATTEKNLGI